MTLEDLLKQKPGPLAVDLNTFKAPEPPSEPDPEPETKSDIAQTMFHKGVQLLKNRAPFDAIPYLYASWALDETCLKAANNIAISFWQLNCPDLALRTVEKVLSMDPDNATAKSHQIFMQTRMNKQAQQ